MRGGLHRPTSVKSIPQGTSKKAYNRYMTKHSAKFVAYYRVSTDKQGIRGLGIAAQETAVRDYLNGGHWELVGQFTEVESGKRNDRPELAKALAECRLRKATLIIAKLDRLARNVAFISNLMESKADFVAVDFPQANRLTIHILAAVAEHEARMISERTKAALAEKKKQGKPLGRPNPEIAAYARQGSAAGLRVRREKARERARDLQPALNAIRAKGVTSHNGIARELNALGHTAPKGGSWSQVQVMHLLRNTEAA